MPHTKTIAAISQPRVKPNPAPPQAKSTPAELKEKREESKKKQEKIDAAVSEWFSDTNAKAVELSREFNKKPRFFLDLFFQGGAHMVNHHEKINPYNAFKAEKAAQLREEGSKGKTAPELHEEFHAEYEGLTTEEKDALIERFTETKVDITKIRRDTPRARVQDVSNTVRNIRLLMHSLSVRVGVEGFFCIVRNNPDFYMTPQWYFTTAELERYMPLAVRRKWDTSDVGTRLEAFSVAGCDTMNLLRTSKQKIDFLKGEIRDAIRGGLAEITGREKITMQYMFYTEEIVLRYNVVLVGWTADKFCNPSELSSSILVLTTLRDAIKSGECKWVKVSAADMKIRRAEWKADVAAGKVLARSRNLRSDLGQKRPRPASEDNGDASSEDDDEEPEEIDGTTGATTSVVVPKKKRAKTTTTPVAESGPSKKVAQEKGKRAKQAPKGKGAPAVREDFTTRAALSALKKRRVSRAFISDDDENEERDVGVPASGTAVPAAAAGVLGPSNGVNCVPATDFLPATAVPAAYIDASLLAVAAGGGTDGGDGGIDGTSGKGSIPHAPRRILWRSGEGGSGRRRREAAGGGGDGRREVVME
ncbi:hypothetical protein B0H17DRAFT_1134149 [Mycena rosella]|uniref:Uncharacterized protein n=1 Tax=Mycena rosella TaxID=1033263 RepID=A0AAD7GJI5_MYCRO|nr:hypothetical protein B0H17DRAFT_1134149 [Mycena rosella]